MSSPKAIYLLKSISFLEAKYSFVFGKRGKSNCFFLLNNFGQIIFTSIENKGDKL